MVAVDLLMMLHRQCGAKSWRYELNKQEWIPSAVSFSFLTNSHVILVRYSFSLLLLQLKPRGSSSQSQQQASSNSGKSSIFGAAKPREEVLASKGIDAKLVDERITKKATTVHYTRVSEYCACRLVVDKSRIVFVILIVNILSLMIVQ